MLKNNSLYLFSPLLFYILLLRSSLDPLLELTKFGGIGLGAVLNIVVVTIFLFTCLKVKFEVPKAFLYVWGGFIVIGLFSICFSPEKITSLRSFFSVLTYYSIFCLSFYFVSSKNCFLNILLLVVFSSIIPFLFSFFELVFSSNNIGRNGFRLFGSFMHPNIYAFYLVLVSSVTFYLMKSSLFSQSLITLRMLTLLLTVSLVCILLTKTRSAWIAMIIVFFIYGLLSEKKYLIYLFIFISLSLCIPEVQERVFDIFSKSSNEINSGEALNSYSWRKLVWFSAWEYIVDEPFFGHGYDTFSYYFLRFFILEENKGFDAHNSYVQVVFDMGFIGLLSFLIIFIAVLWRLISFFKIDPQGYSIFLGLFISYILVGYSDNILFYLSYNWYFWLVIGCVYFYPRVAVATIKLKRFSYE